MPRKRKKRTSAQNERRRKGMRSCYILTDGFACKVGTSHDTDSRISALQTGNPRALKLLGTLEGGEYTEQFLHMLLRECQLNGEWHALTEEQGRTVISAMQSLLSTLRKVGNGSKRTS